MTAFRYLRRHHLALAAIFLALGGTGAYAAASAVTGQVRGFSTVRTGTGGGRLASLGGLTLLWKTHSAPDERDCYLVARSGGSGDLAVFSAHQRPGNPKAYSVFDKSFTRAGSVKAVHAQFLPGAPGVPEQVEGNLTFNSGKVAVTGIFHIAAVAKKCLFAGTLTSGS